MRLSLHSPVSCGPVLTRADDNDTEIKYNAEGDLLFSCSKDHVINAWHSHNGERLGTYDGHNGTVWTIDVDCESTSNSFAALYAAVVASAGVIREFPSPRLR